MRVERKDNNMAHDVREMTSDEIDTSDSRWFVDDESGHIFKEDEIKFV